MKKIFAALGAGVLFLAGAGCAAQNAAPGAAVGEKPPVVNVSVKTAPVAPPPAKNTDVTKAELDAYQNEIKSLDFQDLAAPKN